MFQNKERLLKIGGIAGAVLIVLGVLLFVVLGNDGTDNKNPNLQQTENDGTDYEGSSQGQDESDGSLMGSETEIESETESEIESEIGTEDGIVESTENESEDVESENQTPGQGGTSQNGGGQSGTSQNGADQNGSSQNGTSQNGAGQNGTSQNGTNQNGNGQNKPSNDSGQKDKTETGLGKEDYDNIVQSSGSGSSKEKQLAKQIAQKIIKSGMSDFEKVKAINEYIILNVTYDRENYEKDTIPYESYTALGAMEKKVAVCAGYAQMFQLVAEAAGLSATYVVGDTPYGYHGWNQVKVDGKWYNIDTTWNDGDYETRDGHFYCGCYEYFLLSNEDFSKSHTPLGEVNNTGSSKDFEGIKKGCPYEGETPYCETQADVTKVVKEMVDSNTMQKRVLVSGAKTKEMVENALKELKVYAGFTVNIENKIRVYSHSKAGLYRLTININLEADSFDEARKQKITSMQDAKRVCEEKMEKFVPGDNNTLDTYVIYVSPKYVGNKEFEAELMRWAFYEKKFSLYILNEWKKVDDDTYSTRIGLDSAKDATSAYESIYHTKDIEAAIQRMFQYGYKRISLYVQPSDYKLTGSFNEAGYAFENTFCKPLNEKYCLRSDWDQVHPDENEICVYFSAEGHDTEYVDWEIEKEATCVSNGLEVKRCKICHEIAEKQSIPKDDNHDYYWDTKGTSRTRKCHSCSYKGISEVCINGVWGYFDNEKAQVAIQRVNELRAQHVIYDTDPFGNLLGTRRPEALVVSDELTKKAKERLADIAPLAWDRISGSALPDEYVSKTFQHLHDPKHQQSFGDGISDREMVDEKYGTIGAVCFYYDFKGDGSWMMPIYILEFGLVDNE